MSPARKRNPDNLILSEIRSLSKKQDEHSKHSTDRHEQTIQRLTKIETNAEGQKEKIDEGFGQVRNILQGHEMRINKLEKQDVSHNERLKVVEDKPMADRKKDLAKGAGVTGGVLGLIYIIPWAARALYALFTGKDIPPPPGF